jgi:DNA helicase-2/ATP-dependent DNA helicase PcrA
MATTAHARQVEGLLEGLNEPQREAVTHGEGPLLILAGAGSGKTRVLTHRVAFLIFTGRAQAGEILSITFTNKAAQEMRGRVEGLLGRRTRGMWLMTFHAACARMLRGEAERLGYTRQFTIYDQGDSRRMVKQCIEELGLDPKRFSPAAIHGQISSAKNRLRDAAEYGEMVGSYFEQAAADVYRLYEAEMVRSNAMDFDDLLLRMVNVLELFEEVRERYARAFSHVLVDEYQDTNHAQYRLLQLLVGGGREAPGRGERVSIPGHRNLAVVGDDSQCLARGTLIAMADGAQRPIEDVQPGEQVLAAYGSGDFRPAVVLRRHETSVSAGIEITTRAGRRVISTPDHIHFAGFVVGRTPQMHMTYLMWKRGVGFRVGTSRTYTAGQSKPVIGVRLRVNSEGADAAWIVSVHASDAEARVAEHILSARYGLPTLPFYARPSRKADGSLVGSQALIDRVFAELDTVAGGQRLLADEGLSLRFPHVTPYGHTSGRRGSSRVRRRMVLTLCGDRRGASPMHRIAMFGYDTHGRETLEGLGLSIRPARRGSAGWRYETAAKDMGSLVATAEQVRDQLDVHLHLNARLARNVGGMTNTLPFMPASALRPGMVVVGDDGKFDLIESVERVTLDAPVYDLDVQGVHNFIANGLVTHNSVYGFRGADVRNILDFQEDFPDARVVKLEQNYRSTQTILDAANAVIRNNRGGIAKRLWSELGEGDPIEVRELEDEHGEARLVVGEIERLLDEGSTRRSEIAVLYRTNAMSRVIEDALVRHEIAYQVIGGTKFYERAEIKDAMAYLSLLCNPQDSVSFTRIVNSPRRGIGQTSVGKVLAHARTIDMDVWDVAAAPEEVPGLGAAAQRALGRIMGTMTELRELARENGPIGDLLAGVLSRSGYVEALEAERTIEAQGRIENLEQLVEVGREFDEALGRPGAEGSETASGSPLETFLAQVALVADADARREDESLVTLMTLHNAKGLEYPVVFIVGCEDGVFPHSRALDEGSLEEERRLFYVGVTRAMRTLYLTYARRRVVFGSLTPGLPSRFLDEVPAELTNFEAAPGGGFGGGGTSLGGGAGLGAGLPRAEVATGRAAYDAAAASAGRSVRRRAGSRIGADGTDGAWPEAGGTAAEPAPRFKLGDDVAHPSFGEGVVTGLEPGGIIVVRFARDGSERKLVAEIAPVRRR